MPCPADQWEGWVLNGDKTMLEQSAVSLTWSTVTGTDSTAILKARKLYSGIRVSLTYTDNGAVGQQPFEYVNGIVVDVPEYGNNSRRVDLAGNTMPLLPMICQLGKTNSADAASATSCSGVTMLSEPGFAYFDIPINKQNLTEDIRITINGQVEVAGDDVLTATFAFLDMPMRNVFFRGYDNAATTGQQNWFPTDGVLRGTVLGQYDTAWAVGAANAFAWAGRDDDVTQVTLNGEQATTFANPELLGAGLDEIVGGGVAGGLAVDSYYSVDTYSLLQQFPALPIGNAQYLDYTSGATEDFLVLAVMSDA